MQAEQNRTLVCAPVFSSAPCLCRDKVNIVLDSVCFCVCARATVRVCVCKESVRFTQIDKGNSND